MNPSPESIDPETQETGKQKRKYCDHGRRRSECKECGGSGICEHGRKRGKCKLCAQCKYETKRMDCADFVVENKKAKGGETNPA